MVVKWNFHRLRTMCSSRGVRARPSYSKLRRRLAACSGIVIRSTASTLYRCTNKCGISLLFPTVMPCATLFGAPDSHVDFEQLGVEIRVGDLQPSATQTHQQRHAHIRQRRPPSLLKDCTPPFPPQNDSSRLELLNYWVWHLGRKAFADRSQRRPAHGFLPNKQHKIRAGFLRASGVV